jgi:hypothetical protein
MANKLTKAQDCFEFKIPKKENVQFWTIDSLKKQLPYEQFRKYMQTDRHFWVQNSKNKISEEAIGTYYGTEYKYLDLNRIELARYEPYFYLSDSLKISFAEEMLTLNKLIENREFETGILSIDSVLEKDKEHITINYYTESSGVVTIIDSIGRIVHQNSVNNAKGSYKLNSKHIPQGPNYFIFSNDKIMLNKKFIKQ